MIAMQRSVQLGQLQAVMKVRVRKLHKLYLAKLEEWREAKRKVEEQREEVAQLDRDLQSVIEYMERDDVACDPVKLQLGVSRRRWTIYDREQAQYYLDVAEDDLSKISDELDQHKKSWLKAIARENNLGEQRLEALSEERREQEQREEVELDDAFGGKPLTSIDTERAN